MPYLLIDLLESMQGFAIRILCLVVLLCGDGSKLQEKGTFPVVDSLLFFFCYNFLITPESERRVYILNFLPGKFCLAPFAYCSTGYSTCIVLYIPLLHFSYVPPNR